MTMASPELPFRVMIGSSSDDIQLKDEFRGK
jgi:hypothetical protein